MLWPIDEQLKEEGLFSHMVLLLLFSQLKEYSQPLRWRHGRKAGGHITFSFWWQMLLLCPFCSFCSIESPSPSLPRPQVGLLINWHTLFLHWLIFIVHLIGSRLTMEKYNSGYVLGLSAQANWREKTYLECGQPLFGALDGTKRRKWGKQHLSFNCGYNVTACLSTLHSRQWWSVFHKL